MTDKSKKIILLTLLISGFLFAAEAQAVAPLVILGAMALAPLVLWLITTVFSAVIFLKVVEPIAKFAGQLIDWAVSFQNVLLDPEKITVIQTVWTMLRDFVNIFFILILLIIAFATIFNIKNYKASELLPKLIIAALLINFSLVITVWVIELLWVPAAVFLKPFGQEISLKIADTLDIQNFYDPTFVNIIKTLAPLAGPIGIIGAFTVNTTQEIFRAVMLAVNAFLFSWIALILWTRIPVLIGLMVVSPLAWLGYTLPAVKKQTWDAWWQKLFCWGAIPIPLFGLIYFVILFNQRLKTEISVAIPSSFWNTILSFLGLSIGQTLVWLITVGILVAGMIYIKGLSCSMYGWMSTAVFGSEKGRWKGIWGEINRGVGKVVDFGYAATGAAGAVKGTKGRILEAGLFGGGGAAGRQAREERIEDRLAGWAGLKPKYKADVGTLERAGKAEKDIENKLSRVHTKDEEDKIIAELKTKVKEEAKDPETLAAINTLAKRGQLDAALFNQAVDNFKDTPLAINGVFAKWKEGKFGGITAKQFLQISKDDRVPLEARRTAYSFLATEDAKKVAEEMTYEDYEKGYQILGRKNTKEGRDFKKNIGKLKPTIVAQYNIQPQYINQEIEKEEDRRKILDKKPEDRPAASILSQIEGAGAKDMGDYAKKEWDNPDFKKALDDLIKAKEKRAAGSGRQYVQELRRRFIREGKDKQLETINSLASVILAESKRRAKGEKETRGEREAREAEEEEEEEEVEKKT